ncbi:hypothetical protein D3C85_1188710 [compost metagenome]
MLGIAREASLNRFDQCRIFIIDAVGKMPGCSRPPAKTEYIKLDFGDNDGFHVIFVHKIKNFFLYQFDSPICFCNDSSVAIPESKAKR